jgi:hypothetical protein
MPIDILSRLPNQNVIINGDFRIWQNGTDFSSWSYQPVRNADRWVFNNDQGGGSVGSFNSSLDVPTLVEAGYSFPYSFEITQEYTMTFQNWIYWSGNSSCTQLTQIEGQTYETYIRCPRWSFLFLD